MNDRKHKKLTVPGRKMYQSEEHLHKQNRLQTELHLEEISTWRKQLTTTKKAYFALVVLPK